MNKLALILLSLAIIASCSTAENQPDAYGYFEADQTIISAESAGRLLQFIPEEGDILTSDQVVGQIDSLPQFYKKQQLISQIAALNSSLTQIESQKAVVDQQSLNLKVDQKRIDNLVKTGAATQKQKDDIYGQLQVLDKQINSIISQKSGLQNQIQGLKSQLDELNYSIEKTTIKNPIQGTVLTKMAMMGEVTAPGKPLYAIANLSEIKLKAYVSGAQLPKIKIGQKAQVMVDDGNGSIKKLSAQVVWISASAEFTPKTIQTREERVNLVYAVKLNVKNDGSLKIGMPGEVDFE